MNPEEKKKLALALWAVGVWKAKIMVTIMMAFNQLIERDIYIRGVDANVEIEDEKHDK